jgi:hypothetical protein
MERVEIESFNSTQVKINQTQSCRKASPSPRIKEKPAFFYGKVRKLVCDKQTNFRKNHQNFKQSLKNM